MSDDGHRTERAQPRHNIRTACHGCHGQGVVWVPRFTIRGSSGGTMGVWEECKAPGCKKGWLDGLQPPA